ncbi:MAG TPA: acetylxylan esterase [Spirochaetota bacterium]
MSAYVDFDKYFLNLPPVQKEDDFDRFWSDAMRELKNTSMEPESKPNANRGAGRFDVTDVTFSGIGKTRVNAVLFVPKTVEKPRPVIVIHDYIHTDPYKGFGLDERMAYLFLQLRGHKHIKELLLEQAKGTTKSKKFVPGYLEEKILEPDRYYVKGVYLDALRAIDFLRLNRKLDCSSIGIIGKGLGAAAAVFATAQSSRVSALVIDSPAFTYLDEWHNESSGAIADEITGFIKHNPGKRNVVKRSLSYFDTLAFSDQISCPVMLSVGLQDKTSPPQCAFALFNHLICDKEAQIYPDEGNESGGEKQFRKALKWLRKNIS